MWFKWEQGRQGTGYEKLKLWSFFRSDCYVLRYPVGSYLPVHTDPVTNRRHFRINWVVKHAIKGGQAACLWPLFRVGRLTIFRSDLAPHCVTTVEKGTRIVLSIGIAI